MEGWILSFLSMGDDGTPAAATFDVCFYLPEEKDREQNKTPSCLWSVERNLVKAGVSPGVLRFGSLWIAF
jgi:hypothetical protein